MQHWGLCWNRGALEACLHRRPDLQAANWTMRSTPSNTSIAMHQVQRRHQFSTRRLLNLRRMTPSMTRAPRCSSTRRRWHVLWPRGFLHRRRQIGRRRQPVRIRTALLIPVRFAVGVRGKLAAEMVAPVANPPSESELKKEFLDRSDLYTQPFVRGSRSSGTLKRACVAG